MDVGLRKFEDGKRYLGSTELTVDERILWHNAGDNRFTKGHSPWKIIYCEKQKTKSDAVKRERYLKSGKGREELKNILI